MHTSTIITPLAHQLRTYIKKQHRKHRKIITDHISPTHPATIINIYTVTPHPPYHTTSETYHPLLQIGHHYDPTYNPHEFIDIYNPHAPHYPTNIDITNQKDWTHFQTAIKQTLQTPQWDHSLYHQFLINYKTQQNPKSPATNLTLTNKETEAIHNISRHYKSKPQPHPHNTKTKKQGTHP